MIGVTFMKARAHNNKVCVPRIPLEVLFGDPERMNSLLSPDGRRPACVAPLDGVLNLWVRSTGKEDDKPLTAETQRGIWSYEWMYDSQHLIFRKDTANDEYHRQYSVNAVTGEIPP